MRNTQQTSLLMPASDDVFYLESSLPAGMTISEYRRSRPRRPTGWERLKRLAGWAGGGVSARHAGATSNA
jgi:hypothetical protein